MFLKISFHIGQIRIWNDNSGSGQNIPDPTGSGSRSATLLKLTSIFGWQRPMGSFSYALHSIVIDSIVHFFWPKVILKVNSGRLWFQQNGTTVHTTLEDRQWLEQKFYQREISGHTDHPKTDKSPDLSQLDYWFWSLAMRELTRVTPSSLEELKSTGEGLQNLLHGCGESKKESPGLCQPKWRSS